MARGLKADADRPSRYTRLCASVHGVRSKLEQVACSARLYLFLYHLRGELVLVGAQSPRGHQRVAFDEHGHGGRCDQRD